MADFRDMEQRLTEILGLQRRPVAVTFRATLSAGVLKFTGTAADGRIAGPPVRAPRVKWFDPALLC